MQEIRSCWNSLVQFAKLRQFHLSQPPRKPFPSFRRAAYVRKTWNCRTSKSCRLYISTSSWFGVWIEWMQYGLFSCDETVFAVALRIDVFFIAFATSCKQCGKISTHVRCILSGWVLAYKLWESRYSGQGPAWRESICGRKPQQLGLLGRFEQHEIGSREVWNDKLQKIQGDDRPVLTSIVFLFPF